MSLGRRELGLLAGAAAYGSWGLFPIYFKALSSVPAPEILAHRVAWAQLFLVFVIGRQGKAGSMWKALRTGRSVRVLALSALAIAVNWLVYIYSVVSGRILDSSLGYFINPLVNVLLGVLVLRESLAPIVVLAMSIAASGVALMTLQAGQLPWIALTLAVSFGCYGMLRKLAPVGAVEALGVETLLLLPLACGYLAWCQRHGTLAFLHGGSRRDWLLVLSGPLTAIPLLFFGMAARRLPLSTLGFLQYLSPTLQFLLGVFVYGEPFAPRRAIAFVLIWIGLAIFALHSLRRPTPPVMVE
jgi:chloramphenicol-sensitive protein RarD